MLLVKTLMLLFRIYFFILVNVIMIIRIIDERRSRFIPHEIKDIKNTIFKNLTSKEFLYLWSLGKISSAIKEYLLMKGKKQNKLMFMPAGKACDKKWKQAASNPRKRTILSRNELTYQ